jgi:hypothetical protein
MKVAHLCISIGQLAMVALLCGCGAGLHTTLDIKEGYTVLRQEYAPLKTEAKAATGEISVVVVAPRNLGCFSDNTKARCSPLKSSEESAQWEEIDAKANDAKISPYVGWILTDIGPMTVKLLQERLAARIGKVSVTLASSAPGDATSVAPLFDGPSLKGTRVRLVATLPGESPIDVAGDSTHKLSNGHLAWMIPAFILTFPLSMFWVGPAMGPTNRKHQAIAIAEATDLAATQLADRLALHAKSSALPRTINLAMTLEP